MPTPRGPQEENLEKNSLIFVCATPMGRPRRKVDDPLFIRREDLATCRLILKDIYQVNCEKRDCHLRIEGDMTKGPASGPRRCECRRELVNTNVNSTRGHASAYGSRLPASVMCTYCTYTWRIDIAEESVARDSNTSLKAPFVFAMRCVSRGWLSNTCAVVARVVRSLALPGPSP